MLRRKNDGVANLRLAVVGVPPISSSAFRFKGVPAYAVRKKRFPDDCGVLERMGSEEVGLRLLGVASTLFARARGLFGCAFEGVSLDSRSKIPRTAPSRCGVGPRACRMHAGVASISCGEGMAVSSLSAVLLFFCGVALTMFAGRSLKAVRSSAGGDVAFGSSTVGMGADNCLCSA